MKTQPFSCGSQYGDWKLSNCERCTKRYDNDTGEWPCDIEYAIDVAYFTDGEIDDAIADRMGRGDGRYNWPCLVVEWTEAWKAEVIARREVTG